jgi:hypothetical protein
MDEPKVVKNIIGGEHTIGQNKWALSLVRKFNADHAYLILESLNEKNEPVVMDFHLVVKKDSNEKKGDVVCRNISNKLEELKEIGESCSSYTWEVNHEQVLKLSQKVKEQKKLADEDKINYVYMGKSKISGGFASLAEDAQVSLGTTSDNASVDTLLREGHNCGSWAVAMAQDLGLPFRGNYVPFVAFIPRIDIMDEPDTKMCVIL